MAVGISPKITLSEDNIQGASLRGKTPSQLTIPEVNGMAFLPERREIERKEAISGRKVKC